MAQSYYQNTAPVTTCPFCGRWVCTTELCVFYCQIRRQAIPDFIEYLDEHNSLVLPHGQF